MPIRVTLPYIQNIQHYAYVSEELSIKLNYIIQNLSPNSRRKKKIFMKNQI